MIYNFNDIHFSYPLDVVRRRMQLAGAVTDGYKYRYCLLAFFQFVHSVLSLKAGARGFPPACMCMNPGYSHRKKKENRLRKLPSHSVPCLLVAYLWQLEVFRESPVQLYLVTSYLTVLLIVNYALYGVRPHFVLR